MYQVDAALKSVVDGAMKRGFVSYHQVNAYLPDEGGDPGLADRLILTMEELGLDLADDPQAPKLPDADDPASSHWSDDSDGASLARSIIGAEAAALSSRDPIRMYLSQMGNMWPSRTDNTAVVVQSAKSGDKDTGRINRHGI